MTSTQIIKSPLTTIAKQIQRQGAKPFLEHFHVALLNRRVKKTRTPPPALAEVGHEVKYNLGDKFRTGTIRRVNAATYTIQGRRTNKGVIPIHEVPHNDVVSSAEWENRKVTPTQDTTDGSRTYARNVLSPEEWRQRGQIAEKRLGFSENHIIDSLSFMGPAIKICSGLAQANGISTKLSDKPGLFWARAEDPDFKEMLMLYSIGAMKSWRRLLSTGEEKAILDVKAPGGSRHVPADDQARHNLEEFRDVIRGKRHSSYIHLVKEREGKSAAIKFLKERQDARFSGTGPDFSEMDDSPGGREILYATSTQPEQLHYALAVNNETLGDDINKVISTLPPTERVAVQARFGIGSAKQALKSNSEVAAFLNENGHRDEGNRWTRNSVGGLLQGAYEWIRMATADENKLLSQYVNHETGRTVPLSQWSLRDQTAYHRIQAATGLLLHLDVNLGRTGYNAGTSPTGRIQIDHQPEPHGPIKQFTREEIAAYRSMHKSLPAEYHPAGKFVAAGIVYAVVHQDGEAILVKAERDGREIFAASFGDLFKAVEENRHQHDQMLMKSVEDALRTFF